MPAHATNRNTEDLLTKILYLLEGFMRMVAEEPSEGTLKQDRDRCRRTAVEALKKSGLWEERTKKRKH